MVDIADSVHRSDRANHDSVPGTRWLAVPRPPFMAKAGPNILPTVAPAPAPTLPSGLGLRLRRASLVSGLGIRTNGKIAHTEVHQNGSRHNRNDAGPQFESELAFSS